MRHNYERDSQSGAGNCICGAAETHQRHPHEYRRVAAVYSMTSILLRGDIDICVCGLPPEASQHLQSLSGATPDTGKQD
jgi:hypothetical protein